MLVLQKGHAIWIQADEDLRVNAMVRVGSILVVVLEIYFEVCWCHLGGHFDVEIGPGSVDWSNFNLIELEYLVMTKQWELLPEVEYKGRAL